MSSSGSRPGRVTHNRPVAAAAPSASTIAITPSQIDASELDPELVGPAPGVPAPWVLVVDLVPAATTAIAGVGPGWEGPFSTSTPPGVSGGPVQGLTRPSA